MPSGWCAGEASPEVTVDREEILVVVPIGGDVDPKEFREQTRDDRVRLAQVAEELLAELLAARRHPVRLMGIRAERLSGADDAVQDALLWEDERSPADWSEADRVADDIRRKFPSAALRPATIVDGRPALRRPDLR